MRKPIYHVFVTQESQPDPQGEKKHLVDESRRRFRPSR